MQPGGAPTEGIITVDSLQAFAMADAARKRGDRSRVFDWIKAAELIRDTRPDVASAGLRGDWEYTGGDIYRDGKPVPDDDTYTYLASIWAIPELDLDGDVTECWIWKDESPGWSAGTYWPDEALALLPASPPVDPADARIPGAIQAARADLLATGGAS